jgi:heme/copper-type cytochrome/quinol oxidase subunit 2
MTWWTGLCIAIIAIIAIPTIIAIAAINKNRKKAGK